MNFRQLSRLTDSQETASIKEARKLLVEKAGMTDEQADKWVRGDLRATFPILRDKKAAKFILGTTRLLVEQQLNDADAQNKLTRVLKEINEAHYDEFDRNLNGKSLSELYSPLESKFKEADKATREASSNKQFDKSDYTIHGPYDSFEQAKKAWGNRSQDWCVFHMKDMYDNYTSAGQRFYVAAHNGWESVPNKVGDNAPKDAYGNSLIAISVDIEGNLATSTPRWNHAHGGGDNTYTVDELEDILQMPFYETFKPYTDDERRARGIVSFAEAAERLASGEDPHDIFSAVGDFQEGFAAVKLNNRYNFINTHNNLLSDQWFDSAVYFHEGFARVNLNGKHNFIDTKGNLLSDQWFDYADNFQKGFAVVKLNRKWNFINTEGNLLSDQWFDYAGDFHEGFAVVESDSRWNFINTEGNLLSDQWFDYAGHFNEGFVAVNLNDKWNFIDTDGNFLSNQRFDCADDFHEGFARVTLNDKRNFIDTKGNFLSSQWFDSALDFHEGFARVTLNDKRNFIDTKGNFLSSQWFDSACNFHEGFADVKSDGRWHRINTEGRIVDSKRTSNLNCKKLLKLSDSQETASIKEARKLLVEKANMTDEQADKWVRGDLRAAFPILRDKKAAKFILGTTRLLVEQQLNDADAQNKLTRVLKEINEAHYDEFDRNLNGKSLQDLYSPFEQTFKEADKATREASSSKQFGKSDYIIHGPYDSFEQAEEEWGNNSQDWCVFHRQNMYDSYTSAGQRFYVAAQNGWKHIRRVAGEDAPKDTYGNSLIAISVDIEGNLATSTPRWNHENGGGDNTYTVDELEDILQMPFYETFEPYTKEERRARGIVSFAEAAERLASGEDPHDIFSVVGNFYEGSACVKLNNRYNFIDTHNNLLFDQWFDSVGDFQEGFAAVKLNGKWNLLDIHNNLLSDQWFDNVGDFQEGFAAVKLNGKWNFVDTHNNLLFDQWFDSVGNFQEGFASVKLNNRYNFINTHNNLLTDQWFDYVDCFYNGFAVVKSDGKWNFIDTNGNFLSSQWFDNVGDFHEGFARVMLNVKWNLLDIHNNLLSDRWFDSVGDFQEGFATVKLNGKWNFIDTNGDFLSDRWFDRATAFNGGFADVFLNGRWHYINTGGRIVDSKRTSNLNCKKLLKLSDSQETASIKEARKLLVEKAGMTDEQADKWVRGDLRATFPILRDKKAAKFILGTTRLFVEQQLNDADSQNKLTRVLKEINEARYDEFDRNLNGKSLQDLYSPFEQTFKEADKATRETSSSKQFSKSDYIIHGPYDSFEQAKKAWGNNSQDWCVFHRKDMYVNYTSAGQRFYVAAQNGWESVPREVGVDAPKDAYGNSLIAISVDIEGNLATSTPRWNHANGGGDNTYTVDELEDILQMPFYETFEPYTEEERRARGIVSFKEAAERLASGEDPHDIFSVVGHFHDGFARVILNGKRNFVDVKGNFLSSQWFDYAGDFQEGFAAVKLNGKWNLLDIHNNLLSDQWFDYVNPLHEGFARVMLNGKRNFVDVKGNFLSDQWFDRATAFNGGFADVFLNGRWHRINTEGSIVDSKRTSNLNCKKLLKLSDSQETASIKKAAKRLALGEDPHDIFDYVYAVHEGFSCVQLRDKYNFIDTNGNFLSSQWFDYAGDFYEGFATVKLNGKWNYIDTEGNFLLDQWFDVAYSFHDGFACVWLKSKWNFIDTKGNFLSDRWFDDSIDFRDGVVRVKLDSGWHLIDKYGTILDSKRTYNLNCKKLLKHIK